MKPWICWVVWLLAFSAVPCLAAPEYPPYTGKRITVLSSTKEDFAPLEAAIRELERDRVESYFVVIRDAPDESSSELLNYISTLSRQWNMASLNANGGWEWRYSTLIVLSNPGGEIHVELGPQLQGYLQMGMPIQAKPPELARIVAPTKLGSPMGVGGMAAALVRKVRAINSDLRQFENRNASYPRGDFAKHLIDEKRQAEFLVSKLEMEQRGRRSVEKLLSLARPLPAQFEALKLLRLRDPFAAKRKLGDLLHQRDQIETKLNMFAVVGPETKALIEVAKTRQIACRMAFRRIPEPQEPDLREQMKANEQRLDEAEAVAANDYDEAQALAKEAAKQAETLLVSIVERASERKQEARSRQAVMVALPMASGFAIPIGVFSYLWKRRGQDARRRSQVSAGVSSSNLVLQQFSDRLNELSVLEKRLSGNANPAATPWRGNSQELYVAAVSHRETALHQWENLSATAAEIQRLLRQKNALDRSAEERLSGLGETAELEAALTQAETAFTRLEEAVRESAEASRAAEAGLVQAERQLRAATQAGFSLLPCQQARSQSEERLRIVRTLAASDPLEAADQARALAAQVAQLNERLGRVATEGARHGRLLQGVAALESSASNLRASGLRLREAGVDPDPLLAYACEEAADAWRCLNGGETAEAAAHLDLGERLARRADQSLAAQVHARDYCANELPRQHAEAARLRQHLEAGNEAREPNQPTATLLSEVVRVEAQITEAATLATPETQEYRPARERLEAAAQSLRKLSEQLA